MKRLDEVMNAYAKEHGYYYIAQGSNPVNEITHYQTTAPEIWEDTGGKVDYAVCCVGTGGTLAGISRYFCQRNPVVRIVGVQPAEISRRTAEHPNPNVIDVAAEDAYAADRKVALTDGVFLRPVIGGGSLCGNCRSKESRGLWQEHRDDPS